MTFSRNPAAVRCPVCHASDLIQLAPYNGYEMLSCAECGLIFCSQRNFSPSIYDEIYRKDPNYLARMSQASATTNLTTSRRLGWFRRRALRWMKRMPVRRSLLDVGCSTGIFLYFAKRLGWDVCGVEPVQAAADTARSLGLDVYCGYLDDFVRGNSTKFGLVTCFEVLEHVADPVALLKTVRSVLAPGGFLIMSVPNAADPYCLQQPWDSTAPPIHINFFNRPSIARALYSAGFTAPYITSRFLPTSSVMGLYGTKGFMLRLPYLFLARLLGRSDGSNLLLRVQSLTPFQSDDRTDS